MDQIYYILKNVNPIYFILFFLFFLLGWLMRKIYKLFMFLRVILFGKSASIKDRNTRRQLLEYATNLKSNKALLIDINKRNISYVNFL